MTGLDKKTDFFSIHCRGSWRRKGQRSAVLDGCMHSHVDVCSRMFWAVSQPRGAGGLLAVLHAVRGDVDDGNQAPRGAQRAQQPVRVGSAQNLHDVSFVEAELTRFCGDVVAQSTHPPETAKADVWAETRQVKVAGTANCLPERSWSGFCWRGRGVGGAWGGLCLPPTAGSDGQSHEVQNRTIQAEPAGRRPERQREE